MKHEQGPLPAGNAAPANNSPAGDCQNPHLTLHILVDVLHSRKGTEMLGLSELSGYWAGRCLIIHRTSAPPALAPSLRQAMASPPSSVPVHARFPTRFQNMLSPLPPPPQSSLLAPHGATTCACLPFQQYRPNSPPHQPWPLRTGSHLRTALNELQCHLLLCVGVLGQQHKAECASVEISNLQSGQGQRVQPRSISTKG